MLQIKTEKFQGPLNLLLKLIEKEKLDITEVNLAKIANQYIEYIKKLTKIDPDDLADFLVVAAKLLLLKSKALLPYLCFEDEDETDELEKQLKMYKEFLQATEQIENIIKEKKFMFNREFDRKQFMLNAKIFSPPKKITKENLYLVFKEFIKQIKPIEEELKEEKLEYKVNIEDKIWAIQQMLLEKIKISFNYILIKTKSKTDVIVSFLAMLELVKQQSIVVGQEGLFGEIMITGSN
ncbi:segregation/condensation protein A [Patescibacteria group bacterium]|nr:segregation/condensation protein A [Patescibacteria group bacterium]MBU1421163.1 segregation/condensation protein A [Patescibacteria group bacterium]MBU2456970.1 segregation/condensation protein A [Patescibacteria group bacterium]